MEKTTTDQYSIFRPKSARGIFMDYPKLRHYEAFKGLSNYDMLFVWYYACESSPLFKIKDNRKRIEQCLAVSYLKDGQNKLSKKDKDRYLAADFPAKVENGIKQMQKFKVGPRVQALMMTQKSFDNLYKILDIDASNDAHFKNKDDEVDFSKKKAFVDTIAKAQSVLPSIVNQLEGSFDLSDDQSSEDSLFEGESMIDTYHENED